MEKNSNDKLKYTAEDYTIELPSEEYLKRFRHPEQFEKFCRECPNYGKVWLCPPFHGERTIDFNKFEKVKLIATKITPSEKDLPIELTKTLILPERKRLSRELLRLEKETGGYSFSYAGSCLFCPEGKCSRLEDKGCRYPHLARPSLEAYGFDIGMTLEELFRFPLKWGKDGKMPEYLTLVCGLFY